MINTNFFANINGTRQDVGNILYNWSSNTVNIPVLGTTLKQYSINYKKPTIILETDITTSIDGYPNTGDQVYTFGPMVQNRICMHGSGTNGAMFSNDGITLNPLGTTNISSSTASGILWDGTKWTGTSIINSLVTPVLSYDGIYWYPTGTNQFTGGWGWKTYYNGKIYLMVGGGATNHLAYSYDGINWIGIVGYTCTNVYALVWNGIVWLAGSNGGVNNLAWSYDGITWTGLGAASPIPTSQTNDIIWTGTIWILIGQNASTSQLSYTTNKLGNAGWTSISTSLFSQYGFSLIWNGSIAICGGSGTSTPNALAYSYNCIDWTGLGITSAFTTGGGGGGKGFIWDGTKFILNGSGTNQIAYSYNGLNYVGLGTPIYPYVIAQNVLRPHSITFQRNLTVAVGSGTGTTSAYSLDGITWVSYANTNIGTGGIVYNGKMWVTGSNLATYSIAYSYDGYKWDVVPASAKILDTASLQGITWNGNFFVAVAVINTTGNCIAYSYDGLTWLPGLNTSTLFGTSTNTAWAVASTPKLIVVGGTSSGTVTNTLAYSTNGYKWTGLGTIIGSTWCFTVATNGKMWVAGFNNGLAYSLDGLNWSITATNPFTTYVRGVAWNGILWVAVGGGTVSTSTAYSYDGMNWTSGTCTSFTNGLGVTWNGTMWIATGNGGTNSLAYSYNGITWTGITGTSIFSANGYGISSNYQVKPLPYIQHPTIAFGGSGNTIAYSPDGISWTGLGTNVFTTNGRRGFWNGKLWVAGGSGGNTLAYSYDGYKWRGLGSSIFTTTGYCTTYNGNIWVATGQGGNTLAYSQNGIQWNGVVNSSQIFTTQCFGVSWNGNTFLASGQGGNAFATSSDGINWAGVSSATSYASSGVHFATSNGAIWIAAINSPVGLAYTYDIAGKTGWTNVASSPFSTGGSSVAYNGIYFVATGFGTNGIAYSQNGTTWTTASTMNCWDVCWNGKRFVALGYTNMLYSKDGVTWYTNARPDIFSQYGLGIASNSGIGAFVAPSAMVLDNYGISGNGIAASQTLEIVSSDPYYQTGFTNVTVKIETDNLY